MQNMSKDCWQILGIKRTVYASVIKKVFRDKIKGYHPDTVQAPEKIRKYTIKCAELIKAYKEALEYAETHQEELDITIPIASTNQVKPTSVKPRPGIYARVICMIIFAIIIIPFIFFGIELLQIYPAFSKSMKYGFALYDCMAPDNPIKMILSLFFAIIFGFLASGLLSSFTILPGLFISSIIEGTKYEKYTYKFWYIVVAILNLSIVYFTNLHWPFENRVNDYYNFLYHLCRFLSWSSSLIFMLEEWIKDIIKYKRIKDSFSLRDLALYEKE
jgi:hypothetical protein